MSDMKPTRLLINGAQGRMGARIAALARDDARFTVVAAIDRDDSAAADAIAPRGVDVIIDFSTESGTIRAIELAKRHSAALVIGTTGLSEACVGQIERAASSVAVMLAANTSLGVGVLNYLVGEAARLLGPEFNIDLIESHHTMKRDAPSGTALRLVQALKDKANVNLPPERVHSIRAGDIIGEHTIQFSGPGERITISHAASNRDLFARGALRAAAWLFRKPPGRYTIEQSLGLH